LATWIDIDGMYFITLGIFQLLLVPRLSERGERYFGVPAEGMRRGVRGTAVATIACGCLVLFRVI